MQVIEGNMSERMENFFNPAHPSQRDPLEVRIVNLMQKEFLSTTWANGVFSNAREKTVDYFKNSLTNLENPSLIHDETQKILKDLSNIFKSKIISGEENLQKLSKRQSGFIVSNHLGAYKLTGIRPQELGLELSGAEIIHPFVMFYQSLIPVAEQLGDNLYEAAYPSEYPIETIQKRAGSILIPSGKGVFEKVLKASKETIAKYPSGLFTIFPEGGTSGKRNEGGPYDLEGFHTGSFFIAAELDVPIIPVAQYFNPNSGFELGVFESFIPERNKSKEYYENIAESTRGKMQTWLNQRKQSAEISLKS